jgi:stage V sporulation protein AD
MTSKSVGKQSVIFQNPPCIIGQSSIAGKKEGEGPLGTFFDFIDEDPMFGGTSWEDAESRLQKKAAEMAIQKAGLKNTDIKYLISGDLLGQLIATSFGIMSLQIPMFGIYGACSTMGEAMSLGAMIVDGGYADKVVSMTSSHFAGAEKQFRFPLGYGSQRPLTATWTVTGSGAVVIASYEEELRRKEQNYIVIKGATTGKVVDYGIKDSMNMGACMAPAAADVIYNNLMDLNLDTDYYDKIITGDLGYIGKDILIDIMKEKGHDISKNHMDCGIEIFDQGAQDTHAGGSGCGCSAITLTGYIMEKMRRQEWKKVLFVPTGALLSTVSFNEGNSVPGIAHGVILEVI